MHKGRFVLIASLSRAPVQRRQVRHWWILLVKGDISGDCGVPESQTKLVIVSWNPWIRTTPGRLLFSGTPGILGEMPGYRVARIIRTSQRKVGIGGNNADILLYVTTNVVEKTMIKMRTLWEKMIRNDEVPVLWLINKMIWPIRKMDLWSSWIGEPALSNFLKLKLFRLFPLLLN